MRVPIIAAMLMAAPALAAGQQVTAFTGVTVIDGASPAPRADRTVVVRGSRIVAEGPRASTPVPKGARIVAGRGKYLIPGLWDMHVHTVMPGGREVLRLYPENGVTGVRDMAGDWDSLVTFRREIAAGTLTGPRIVTSGPYLEGGDVPIPHLTVKTPADAGPAIDSLRKLGVDFIKIHGQLSRETYFAITREARLRKIPFAGHVPRSVTTAEASDSGQRSIEHLLTIPNRCAPGEAEALAPRFTIQRVFGPCAGEDLAPLFARLVRNDTWMVPTLVAQLEVALWPNRGLPGDSFARYLPDTLRRYVAEIFPMPDDVPPGADVVGRKLFAKRLDIVGAMHAAGVGIMAGTDAPLRNSPPGFGLHAELAYLVEAGMTPREALLAATLAPARFLGLADSLGTVEAGKVADLVLLDADPLIRIGNTRRIAAVLVGGRRVK